jgi:Carboxypeptidase regulatory-like domain
MRRSNWSRRGAELVTAGVFLCTILTGCQGLSAEYGRVSGTVTDTSGNPIMGATVLLTGPGINEPQGLLEGSIDRVFTDAQGNFTINRVIPGWYSLQVISPAKLPGFRNRVQVRPGTTTREAFALGEILSGIRLQPPSRNSHAWGREWKWILRTSASTRPVLRYRTAASGRKEATKHTPLPSRRLVAMVPGTAGANGLSEDPGTDTVVAYLHPLDENSDLLVAGSVSRSSVDGQSVIAEYRRGFLKRNHEDISLAVHQLTLDGNDVAVSSTNGHGMPISRGMVLRYVQTRQLSDALTVTAGFEMKYLNSVSDASTSQPEIDLAYRLDPDTVLNFSYSAAGVDQPNTLLQRVGALNAFPRITLHNFHPRLQDTRHAEVRLQRRLGAASRVELAAYHDAFQNVAVWGIGGIQDLKNSSPAGNVLMSPAGDKAVLNGGNYGSSGGEVAYEQQLGRRGEMGVMYSFGSALAVSPSAGAGLEIPIDASNLPAFLRAQFTQSISGRFSTLVPVLKTQVISTYSWLPARRITLVDPYGQDRFEFEPFWGLQIRQPLPRIDMLPLRIVAIADFRNLLGQGSVALRQADGRSALLTPAYRAIRGGFAVQF